MTQTEKLAEALEALRFLQRNGPIAIQSKDLSAVHRKSLLANGFIKEVIKGWYIVCRPDEISGDSTSWYVSFWQFCASYLSQRFGTEWCLSPEQSLLLHVDNWTVPIQLLVRAKKGNNKITHLLFGTSLLDVRYKMPKKTEIEKKNALNIFSKIPALIMSSPLFFVQYPTDARIVLSTIQDASEILPELLEGGHSTIAGRLVGAFRNITRDKIADDIKKTMIAAGYEIREHDPFQGEKISIGNKNVSPYVARMHLLWEQMRKPIMEHFSKSAKIVVDIKQYLNNVEEQYVADAYHSLSIEGYQVSIELIDKIRKGNWNPDLNETDRNHRNALAARGYWQAFQAVKKSIEKVLIGENAGKIAWQDHGDWFRELFGPSVVAGILKPVELAGYRRHPVYIRRSMHVPPNFSAVPDLMHAFFNLLENEPEASVRVVLGHFFFVFIHPYMDGNGRIGRFLMNLMLASGGYAWTIIPVERREQYMQALEEASVRQNIIPFCEFIVSCITV